MSARWWGAGIFASVLWLQAVGCSSTPEDLRVVATVGDRKIDVRRLKQSYELYPQWRKGMTFEESYLRQLDYVIVNAMYAAEARREGLDRDSNLAQHLAFLRDKELIKVLYEREIRSRIEISDAEYADGYRWLKRSVTFSFIYSPDSIRAVRYGQQLVADSLPAIPMIDPVADVKGIRKSVKYGELAAELERPLFDGRPGDVTGPIPIREGFMVVRLLGGETEKFASEMDFAVQKNRITSVVGNRKADSLARVYIGEMMQDKGLTLNPQTFWSLAPVLARRIRGAQTDPFGLTPVNVTDGDLFRAEDDLKNLEAEVLATYTNGSMTVGDFIAAIGAMPPGMRPPLQSPQQLKDAVALVVRNRYLAGRARAAGLEDGVEVQRDIEEQTDQTLARLWLLRQAESIPVTPEDIADYRRSGGSAPDEQSRMEEIRRRKLREAAPAILDRLRQQYTPKVDTTAVLTMIPQSKERIGSDPTPFVVRELFQ